MNEDRGITPGDESGQARDGREDGFLPVVDPRGPGDPDATAPLPVAPALDIDDRDDDHLATPDIIALPETPHDQPGDEEDALPPPDAPAGTTWAEPAEAAAETAPDDDGAQPGERDEPAEDAPAGPEPGGSAGFRRVITARLPGSREQAGPAGERREPLGKAARAARSFFDFRMHKVSTAPHRLVGGIALLLVMAFLLLNSGGLALIALSCLAPLLVVVTLTQHDVFEKESNLIVAGVTAAGVLAGVVVSGLAAMVQYRQWYDDGVLYYGAGGFGGRFAQAAGTAPVVVWLLVGIVTPAVALTAIGGIPIALRRWPQFRNEVMDGVILGGASAAGFAIGACVVYWWPMIADSGPSTSVSDWTITVLGVSVLRPVTITLCGAMVGAGIWRYMKRQGMMAVLMPAIGGVGGIVLIALGSISFQPAGLWQELLWTLVVLAPVFAMYRRVLDQAVEEDRRALGTENSRIVCPACRKVTPAGQYCAHCGEPLLPVTTAAPSA